MVYLMEVSWLAMVGVAAVVAHQADQALQLDAGLSRVTRCSKQTNASGTRRFHPLTHPGTPVTVGLLDLSLTEVV